MLGQRSSSSARLLQEAGRELVQQAADVLGGLAEQARFLVGAVADDLRARSACSSERAKLRQLGKPTVAELPASECASAIAYFAYRPVQLRSPIRRLRS